MGSIFRPRILKQPLYPALTFDVIIHEILIIRGPAQYLVVALAESDGAYPGAVTARDVVGDGC